MGHLEILDMIARGMFGCPHRLPIDLDNWPQVRPAMRAAHDEIVSLRRQLAAANAEIERIKADIRDLYTERQRLRDILLVPLPVGEGTTAAEFGACYPLVESAQRLRAERDALLNAGCIAMVPVAMKMKETANGKA